MEEISYPECASFRHDIPPTFECDLPSIVGEYTKGQLAHEAFRRCGKGSSPDIMGGSGLTFRSTTSPRVIKSLPRFSFAAAAIVQGAYRTSGSQCQRAGPRMFLHVPCQITYDTVIKRREFCLVLPSYRIPLTHSFEHVTPT